MHRDDPYFYSFTNLYRMAGDPMYRAHIHAHVHPAHIHRFEQWSYFDQHPSMEVLNPRKGKRIFFEFPFEQSISLFLPLNTRCAYSPLL